MLRNKEVQRFSGLFFLMAAAVTALGFSIHVQARGVLAAVSSALFGAVFFAFTKARYKTIAKISEEIDLVLHNEDHLYIDESDAGRAFHSAK